MKCIKGSVMITQMCWNRSTCAWITCCITSGYSTATVWARQVISALFSHSRSVDVHSERMYLKIHLHCVCLAGARVCYRPWMRTMSWTWSTSQRGSFLSPSPVAWKSRAMQPTCGRLPPCCDPSTAKTTWYAFFPTSPLGIRSRNLPWLSSH